MPRRKPTDTPAKRGRAAPKEPAPKKPAARKPRATPTAQAKPAAKARATAKTGKVKAAPAPAPTPPAPQITPAGQAFLDKLNLCSRQEQQFVLSKLDGKSNTQAAKDADYSPRTAKEQGSRLLTRVHIVEAIEAGWIARGFSPQVVLAAIREMIDFDPDDVMSSVNEVVTDVVEVLASTVLADVRLELEVAEEMLRNLPPLPDKPRRGRGREAEREPDPYEIERAVLEGEVARLRKRETLLAVQVRKDERATVMEQRQVLRAVPYIDLDKVRQEGKSKFISNVKNGQHGRSIELISRKDVIQMAGQALGMFREHHVHTGPNGGPIQSETTFNPEKATGEQIADEYSKLLATLDQK
ncbi:MULTISPECIES: terminase small subunit [unclassified Deinococcus]|uniref:terminase small subunit n=1 Tax=unclassified Deinococcus TaxID=2623546 RepID=UPI001C309C69|nr:terminase small subunit [Deinococcus sp. 43]MDK2013558.1 terminase small subunit [Deinococcus sp. 43]